MRPLEALYEGKAKIVYATEDHNLVIQYFKDDATAFNALKKGTINSKGICNNKISAVLFEYLEKNGLATHFVKQLDERSMLVKKLDIIPIEMVARNIAAGSISKRLGLDEGVELIFPVIETYLKSDELGDPLINDDHIKVLNLATPEQVKICHNLALKANELLVKFFRGIGIDLVDIKFEFGEHNGTILLGDEISPDTSRLWKSDTKEKLDKDRFRRDLGKVEEAYQEVLEKVTAANAG